MLFLAKFGVQTSGHAPGIGGEQAEATVSFEDAIHRELHTLKPSAGHSRLGLCSLRCAVFLGDVCALYRRSSTERPLCAFRTL